MSKILGVDDSQTMRRILEMTFAGDGSSSIATVEDGDSAIRWATDNGADLVLADASMSGTDGYEVARALRSNPATQHVAVIVLASQHHPFDAEKARQCGVDDHVLKPFETTAMLEKVRDVLGRPRAGAAPRAASAVAAAPSTGSAVAAPPRPPAPAAVPAPPRPPAPPAGGGSAVAARPAAPPQQPARATVAFGAPPGARPPTASPSPISPPAAQAAPARAVPAPAAVAPKKPELELADDEPTRHAAPIPGRAAASAAATSSNGEMAAKLSGMGLTPDQVEGVLALSREVIERVVWEVVPDLAETMIRDEIRRLTSQ